MYQKRLAYFLALGQTGFECLPFENRTLNLQFYVSAKLGGAAVIYRDFRTNTHFPLIFSSLIATEKHGCYMLWQTVFNFQANKAEVTFLTHKPLSNTHFYSSTYAVKRLLIVLLKNPIHMNECFL